MLFCLQLLFTLFKLSFQWTAGVLCGLFVIPLDGWGSVRVVCHSSGRLGFHVGCLSFHWIAGVPCGLFVIPVDVWGSMWVICHSSGRLGFCVGLSFHWTAGVPCGFFVIPLDGWGSMWVVCHSSGRLGQRVAWSDENWRDRHKASVHVGEWKDSEHRDEILDSEKASYGHPNLCGDVTHRWAKTRLKIVLWKV